jgi:hypothetical protein
MIAIGNYSNGTTQNLTSIVFWRSSATENIEVSSSGLALGNTLGGTATITASLGPASGSKEMSCRGV